MVAFWKDPRTGDREISIEEGSDGVLLSLCAIDDVEEYTADGRSDHCTSSHLVLAEIEQVQR